MISLKKHLDNFDEQGLLLREFEASYKAALEGVEDNLPSVSEKLVGQYRRLIRDLSGRFERDHGIAALREIRASFTEYLQSFGSQADKLLEYKDQQFKEILRCFAEAAVTLARQNTANDDRLTVFTRNLESLVNMHDLTEIRKRLAKEVAGLKQAVAEMHNTGRDSVKQLRTELNQFQEKLAYPAEIARPGATNDALTGLCTRRSAEQAIRGSITAARRLSIVLLDVNGFKGINDHWGHLAGDAVLTQFAGRLAAVVRRGDVVSRWGGDEFLVVMPQCSLENAAARSREFAQACEGEYRLTVAGKNVSLRLRAALGVAEWQSGETAEALIRRVDAALDMAKGNRRGPSRGALYEALGPGDAGIR